MSAELPPQVKAVGLTRHNVQPALLSAFGAELLPPSLQGLPVVWRDVPGRLHAATYLPSAQSEALTPEQDVLEPVILGAQVQNGSADERQGGTASGRWPRLHSASTRLPLREQARTLAVRRSTRYTARSAREVSGHLAGISALPCLFSAHLRVP